MIKRLEHIRIMENDNTNLVQDTTEHTPEIFNTTESEDALSVAQKALTVLIQAVEFAQTKGVYSFEDSHHIYNALKIFRK